MSSVHSVFKKLSDEYHRIPRQKSKYTDQIMLSGQPHFSTSIPSNQADLSKMPGQLEICFAVYYH